MKLHHILLLFVAIVFASCNNDTGPKWDTSAPKQHKSRAQQMDTAAYTYQTYKTRDNDCADNSDSTCTIVNLTSPQYDKLTALNDSITHKFVQLFAIKPDRPINTLEQLAANFIGAYHYFKKGNPNSNVHYSLNANAKVLTEDHYLIIVEVSGISKHGGARPDDLTTYINWNCKKNRAVTLDNVLFKGAKETLTTVAEDIFRKSEKISSTASLNDGRTYFFKSGKFALSDNYVLTNYGIKFVYDPNTVKATRTSVLVPYDHIRPLIKPHFGF